ncbi:MAG: helix-turn-helix transcriptional regulator [Crocosphaera sp.]|uniref:Transcriptional regulator, MarR family Cinnamoyl ester hydrolase n=3 Tax=Crocosphaera watsonii TaxID=263511 RepID=T2JPV9_CROWT|nr:MULTISPECIES: helix-turn-helix domain-containing protein [Crocosphaera]EHJ09517.1 Transcriptional regulator, MarR family; Cinnamoyl ester hydrolase [Crocosphaera watsonii WH 0003]MCH2247132.1 helix-turn-helix transcriptional regulator [Crocosphaera sp.]CCQ58079.1 Transcriptional regulator, HxlR family [Crocosphaera watsonii WH 0005]CCQ67245.1 Transcriptional regulator, MarR family; Cinnamoyl ester hydrolase [Crocosphaera watsonii WH 0402]
MGQINIQTNEKGQKKAVEPCFQPCAIERGMRIIGGKWTGSILWHLKDEPVRFNDLARQLSGASKKVIADRLKEMENNQLIARTVISTRPVAVTYEITDFGRTALEFLEKLKEWVEKNDNIIA